MSPDGLNPGSVTPGRQSFSARWARLRESALHLLREEEGQTTVEYMLGIAVVVIGMSMIFVYMSDSTRSIFNNARRMVELPYP